MLRNGPAIFAHIHFLIRPDACQSSGVYAPRAPSKARRVVETVVISSRQASATGAVRWLALFGGAGAQGRPGQARPPAIDCSLAATGSWSTRVVRWSKVANLAWPKQVAAQRIWRCCDAAVLATRARR
jgi:hypothetical protein